MSGPRRSARQARSSHPPLRDLRRRAAPGDRRRRRGADTAVIGDVVARAVGDSAAPVVLDIGCGPGSLVSRLAHRLPHAVLLGVDVDPLLLALGRSRYGHRIHFIDADVTAAGWTHALSPVQMIDAAVADSPIFAEPTFSLAPLLVAPLLLALAEAFWRGTELAQDVAGLV